MVERDDRPAVATFFTESAITVGSSTVLTEAAAHHARVKRLEAGDLVALTNGQGVTGRGRLDQLSKQSAAVTVDAITTVKAPSPIHLRVPIGDRDRMLLLAEKTTELGITSWQAIRFRRSMSVSPRGEGKAFADKVRSRMISALEQSGGAWLPRLLPDADVDSIDTESAAMCLVLDRDGAPLLGFADRESAAILFGPEGGLEAAERAALDSAGWRPATLGLTTLRFETAGVAAVAVWRAAEIHKGRKANER